MIGQSGQVKRDADFKWTWILEKLDHSMELINFNCRAHAQAAFNLRPSRHLDCFISSVECKKRHSHSQIGQRIFDREIK